MSRLTGELPETMEAFTRLHKVATSDGALDRKAKELIALAIALSVHCDGCIAYHVRDALSAGASREEVLETIGIAVLMGGGPAVVCGCEAIEALDQFQRERRGEVLSGAP